jgi:hypothetical protein
VSGWEQRKKSAEEAAAHSAKHRKLALRWMNKRKAERELEVKLELVLGPADYIGPEWGVD